MALYDYTVDENVAVLTMNNGENRFNLDSVKTFRRTLEEIEKETSANALVVTSAHEKIWCNGIDLEWMLSAVQAEGEGVTNRFLTEMYTLFKCLLMLPMPTVAAINGHAFAGGAFLAFSHDFRFMRSDRGWICLPEVDLGIPLGPVFMAITRHNVPGFLLREMQFTARRYTAQECEAYHMINKACPLDQLMQQAVVFAKGLNKKRNIIGRMKTETYEPILRVIDDTIASLATGAAVRIGTL
jgi:enoyl-CoA hydratase/carnithine racemase